MEDKGSLGVLVKLFPVLGDSYKLGALCKDLSCTYFIKFCSFWQKSLLEKEVGVREEKYGKTTCRPKW